MEPRVDVDDDDELSPNDDDVRIEMGDDAEPPNELNEDFIEDSEEENFIKEEDKDDDAGVVLFEG